MSNTDEKKREIDLTRRVVVNVDYHRVLHLLLCGTRTPDCITVPRAVGIPATARVISMHDDYARASVAFILQDESFEPVQVGLMCPEVRVTWESVKVRIDPPAP